MRLNGLYKLNKKGILFLLEQRCQIAQHYQESKIGARPMFYAAASQHKPEIVYLIPMTTASRHNAPKIERMMHSKKTECNFYEKVTILGKQRFLKIGSVFCVSTAMVNEWLLGDSIYVVENQRVISNVQKKLKVVLSYYGAFPHKSENHIIECERALLHEMQQNKRREHSISQLRDKQKKLKAPPSQKQGDLHNL